MSNERAVPNSIEGLRATAHEVATLLAASDIGGECYHGGRHTCLSRQGRKPLPLYKVEEMCERCAASWHAVMAATILDSVVIGQQFLGVEPKTVLEQHFFHSGNGVSVHGSTVRAKAGRQPVVPPKAPKRKAKTAKTAVTPVDAGRFDVAVEPKHAGQYTPEERKQIVAYYKTLPRNRKSVFGQRYNVKAWQMRDWAK